MFATTYAVQKVAKIDFFTASHGRGSVSFSFIRALALILRHLRSQARTRDIGRIRAVHNSASLGSLRSSNKLENIALAFVRLLF
jgi:hypothetical protein